MPVANAWRRLDGVLLLDKPYGLSSNVALQCARRLFEAAKAGHTGTLDPLATGLLPICFGEATKFASYLLGATKAYRATVRFGVTTTTADAEGQILARASVDFGVRELRAALAGFCGPIAQTPPRHAALKFQGRSYHQYARAGIEIPRTAREVTVHAIELRDWTPPDALVDLVCSKGTYVRVLAEDLGARLGCGAHLAALRRTATGGFALGDAASFDALEAMTPAQRDAFLLPPATLLDGLRRMQLDGIAATRFRHGAAVDAAGWPAGCCAVFEGEQLLGVANIEAGLARPRRVVCTASNGAKTSAAESSLADVDRRTGPDAHDR